MVVYTLEDLKEYYDRNAHGTKAMWAFHCNFHDGHKQCAMLANQYDWTVCFLWNNYAEGMELLTGIKTDSDIELTLWDMYHASEYSDVVMIFTGDYHPYLKDKEFYRKLLTDEFGVIDDQMSYNTLLYSVAVRYLIHETYGIKVDYHPTCGRDVWRHCGYIEWVKKNFGVTQDMKESALDEFGNCISGTRKRMSKELNDRIDRELVLPSFTSIEDVRERIKDIEDLDIKSFQIKSGWITCKFQFGTGEWWYEGKLTTPQS